MVEKSIGFSDKQVGQTRQRPRRSFTLPADLMERLEVEAQAMGVAVSQVVEAHLTTYYAGLGVEQRLDRIERSLAALVTQVLPVVAKVDQMIRQLEAEGGSPQPRTGSPLPVVSYGDIYGADYSQRGSP
jgi:hypothetical protein